MRLCVSALVVRTMLRVTQSVRLHRAMCLLVTRMLVILTAIVKQQCVLLVHRV